MKARLLAGAMLACLADVSPAADWPDGARAAIVLTYDDAAPSQLEHAIPALDAAGLKGTFFLSNVRREDVDRWRSAARNGHELGNHTLNHPCLAGTFEMPPRQQLEAHSPQSVLQEIAQQNALLTAIDGRSGHGFAVPCGQTLAGGRDYLGPLRQSGLVTYSRVADQTEADLRRDPLDLDPMNLPGRAFSGPGSAEPMIRFAEQAANGGGLAVYVFHGVGGDHLAVDAEEHRRLLKWLAERRETYWVATMGELVKWISDRKSGSAAPRPGKEDGGGGERKSRQQ